MVQIAIIGVILMTNLGVTIFAVKSYGSRNGVGLIYEGECSTVKRLDQWLHLLINLLGTGMLSASNYCMQLQAAPTRENVDTAHAKHKWLDIGIPSLRNLKYLTESNRAGDWGWDDTRVNPSNLDYEDVIREIQRNASTYEERNISACFDLYDNYFNPQGNVIVLVKNESLQNPPEDSLLMYVSIVPRLDDWAKNMWALGNGTGRFVALSPTKPVTKWFLGPPHYEVSRCVVQPPEGLSANCRFEYSPPIMFTICIMNLIKAAIMLSIWALRRWQNSKKQNQAKEVLYTLGDAIASFMREPCEQTVDMGLTTKYDFLTTRTLKNRFVRSPPAILQEKPQPRGFEGKAKQWRSSASLRRWVVMLAMCLLVIIIASVLLTMSFVSLRQRGFGVKIPDLWKLGFGALTPYTYLVIDMPRTDPGGLIANVLLANLPQLVLSVLYIIYNTMLSTFLMQREFSRMWDPKNRKPLRVSEPIGIQRSSYFISLPLRYGIPLYASSGILHWLVSQSLFLARIRAISTDGSDDDVNSFSTCGYSPIAVFVTLLAGLLLVVIIIGMGLRRYDGTMPMVSTNSLAISAACHVLEKDRDGGYLLPVQWGVLKMTGGVGKCAFTTAAADTVKVPETGLDRVYK
ncbi:hypothetical protein CORC01_12638 [Colletotrichum orchidophilum]|uniref:DUF6536 domain-containing protein n=1 Tax=Colletotrichum orchidophilum TaxID=1209926 RepID=A0A1G4ASB7_9PEZI|nr:uncharacterized protein CORC01_12638 [Colletotrichum orchidophilum]OHE92057.1 hypothetical protein CORC01_12638 [Colletotrichum orchidophilum]